MASLCTSHHLSCVDASIGSSWCRAAWSQADVGRVRFGQGTCVACNSTTTLQQYQHCRGGRWEYRSEIRPNFAQFCVERGIPTFRYRTKSRPLLSANEPITALHIACESNSWRCPFVVSLGPRLCMGGLPESMLLRRRPAVFGCCDYQRHLQPCTANLCVQ